MAYLRREICVSKSIGLAFLLEVNLPVLLCFTLYLRAIFLCIWRGDLTEGFLRYRFGGLIFGGAYFGILRYAKGAVVNSLLLPNNRERHKRPTFRDANTGFPAI